ncbi:MAG: capsule assembly Wzi family protein [bacterium]
MRYAPEPKKSPTTMRDYHKIFLTLIPILIGSGVQPAAAQNIPGDFWPARHLAVLHDFGYYWSVNTTFKPYRWERLWQKVQNDGVAPNEGLGWIIEDMVEETEASGLLATTTEDTLNLRWWNGGLLQQPAGSSQPFSKFAASPYSYLTLWFRQKLSVQVYLRATSDPESLPHFTGRPRDIRRFGLNSAEFDHATIGYHNSWLVAQFGRGRQSWGPLEENNLVLSGNSPAFDHLLLEGRYKRLKLRFFYGFLESRSDEGDNINRYVVGHGFEYSNRRNLIIGLSELVIFSGVDRPLDIAFLNPFLPEAAVELNDRTNKDRGTQSSNAVWSLMLDWMPWAGLRFSGNFTIDEFQFDFADRREGRPDALAYQTRLAYSRTFGRTAATFSADYTRVGTFTLRHENGDNNFVSRNSRLGTDIGSDADRWRLGVRLLFPQRIIASAAFGYQREGERSLLSDVYQPYTAEEFRSGPFPSGVVERTRFLDLKLTYSPQRNVDFILRGRFSNSSGRFDASEKFLVFSLNAYLPWWFGF